MSTVSESRVVEMRFDNKQFEEGVRETLSTLQTLKDALDRNVNTEVFDNLDRAASHVDLSGLEAGIESLTDRFSTLGIVGMRVIENLTDSLMNFVHKGVSYVTDAISGGGLNRAKNIENARFQLQGILQDEEKVTVAMQNALDSVDKTAYAYDEAAKAASQFAASGVEVGADMEKALKAIAGAAATTSSDYEGMARIFTTVAGNGRLMGDQLLQLSTRGLNAAATLRDYFNGVRDGSIEASDSVKELINNLVGSGGAAESVSQSTEAIKKASNDQYTLAKKAADAEYNLKKKAYDKEYKELQKSLNNECNLKKAEYDKQYKELQASLNAEVEAVQEANSQRLEDAQEKYEKDVEAYRNATDERISLINEEYKESIKLIDEEKYEKLKAVDDKIKAIQDQAKAEQKALKDQANQEKRQYLEDALRNAKGSVTKQKAAEALAELEAQLAREQLAEDRANQIEDLQNQKTKINEEAAQKKEEAQTKAQSAREAVQEESSAELKAMQKAHQQELKEMRKEQAEQISAMREANSERLSAMRESQTEELDILKETQNLQLEAKREFQNEDLSTMREAQQEQLSLLKESLNEQAKAVSKFATSTALTEADIRDMVSQGLINFDLFSEAMATTFGDHAKDADRTFEGSMANIRAAFARTGAMFYSPLIEEGGSLVTLFNTIRDKVNELNNALKPFAGFITTWLNTQVIPKLTEFVKSISFEALPGLYAVRNIMDSIGNVGKFIGSIIKVIVDAFKDLFNIDTKSFNNITLQLKLFTSNLKVSANASNKLSRLLKSISKLFKALWTVLKKVVQVFTPLGKLFGAASDDILDMSDGVAGVIERFANWLETSKTLETVFKTLTKGMELFVTAIITVRDKIKDLSQSIKSSEIGQAFANGFVEGIKAVASAVWDAIANFCKTVIDKVKSLFGIQSPSKVMYEIGENFVKGFLNAIITLGKTILDTITNVFGKVVDTVSNFFKDVDWSEMFKDGLEASTNFVAQFAENIRNGIPNAINAITDFFKGISDFIHNRKDGQEAGEGFGNSFIEGIKNFGRNFSNNVKNIFSNLFGKIHFHFDANAVKEGLANGATYVVNFFKGVKDKLGEYLGKAGDWFSSFFSNLDGTSIAALASGAAAAIGGLILLLKNLDLSSLLKMFKILKPMVKIVKLLSENMEKITSSEKFQELMEKFHLQGADTALNFIAGFVKGLTDKVPDLLDKIKEFALSVIDKVKETFGINSPSTVMIAIGGFLVAGLVLGITQNIGGLRDKISETFGNLVDVVKEAFGKIKDDLPSIAAIALGLGGFIALLKLANTLKKIVNPFQAIGSSLVGVKKALLGYQMDLKADALLKVAEAVALLSTVILGLYEITKGDKDIKRLYVISGIVLSAMTILTIALGLLTKVTHTAKEDSDAWFQAAKGVKKALGAWGMSKILEGFGKSILEIVLSLVVLAKMYDKYPDATDKATGIILTIAILAATFALASAAIAKETGETTTKLQTSATAFLYIAASLLAIINALQKVIDMGFSFSKDWQALALVSGILLLLTGIAIALGKLNNSTDGNLSISGSAILAFCILLYAILRAVERIMEMDTTDISKEKIGILAGIFIAIAIVFNIVNKTSKEGKGLTGAGSALFGACAVILVALVAMYAVVDMPLNQILKGLGVVAAILIVIGITLRLAGGMGGSTEGAYKMVIAIAALLTLMVTALGVFTLLDTKKLIGSAVSLAVVIISVGLCFLMMSRITSSKISAPLIIGMIVVLAEIAASLWFLAKYDFEKMLAAGISMSLVILAYAGCIRLIANQTFNTKDAIAFLLGSLSIIIIGAALAIAASQPWEQIGAAALGISAILLAYSAAFLLFGKAIVNLEDVGNFILGTLSILIISVCLLIAATQPWDQILAAGTAISEVLLLYATSMLIFSKAIISLEDVGNYILGILSVIIVSIALAIAASQPWDSLLAAGTAIGEVLDLYAVAMLIFGKANIKIDDVINFLLGCVGVIAVGFIVKEAASQNWQDLLGAGVSISIVLIAMAVAMLIASFAGTIAPAATEGIGLLDLFIADLVVVLTALGGLSKIPGFTELIADGGEVLVQLGTALGNFVGSIVGGVLESISDTFPDIGTNLSKFIENAQPFLEGINGLDESKVKAASALAGVMMALGVAEFLDSINIIGDVLSIFTPSLADKFTGLGKALVAFSNETESINAYHAKSAAEACVAMVGVMDAIKGRDFRDAEDLEEFGSNIASFAAECKNAYSNLGDKATVELYSNVSEIMKKMIAVVNECTNRDFRDGEQLPEYGNNLADFALDLRAVGSYAKDLVQSNFENLYNCAKWALQIAQLVPRQQDSNSFVGVFAGTNDIGEFGDKLKTFSSSIWKVADDMKDKVLSTAKFKNLYDCASWVLKIAQEVPSAKSGISALISGNNDLKSFGEKIEYFVTSLTNIQENIGNGLNVSTFENINKAATQMIDIANNLKSVAESDKNYNVGTTLKNFGDNLKDFGKNIKNFGEDANKGYLGFSGAVELLQKFQAMIPDLLKFDGTKISTFLTNMQNNGVTGLTNFLNAFNNSNDAVVKAIGVLFSNISKAMTSKKDLMEGYGRVIIGYFKTGVESDQSISKVKSAISSLLDNAKNGVNVDGMKEVGKYAVEGFVRGIREHLRDGRDVGRELGNAAYDAAKRALDEHSPSKKMSQVGSFAGEGFVQGFADWIKAAAQTGTEVGESAHDGLVDALSNIANEIQNEEDFNPTITPVLDLSNVEANANKLGGILNLDKPMQLAANAGMSFTGGLNNLLSNIQASIPDNSNDDVITAINSLRSDISILGDKVAAMQIVMDTGELVGAIATPVDYQLGFNGVLAERGVTR